MYRANKESQALPNKLFTLKYLPSLELNIFKQQKRLSHGMAEEKKYSACGRKKELNNKSPERTLYPHFNSQGIFRRHLRITLN